MVEGEGKGVLIHIQIVKCERRRACIAVRKGRATTARSSSLKRTRRHIEKPSGRFISFLFLFLAGRLFVFPTLSFLLAWFSLVTRKAKNKKTPYSKLVYGVEKCSLFWLIEFCSLLLQKKNALKC